MGSIISRKLNQDEYPEKCSITQQPFYRSWWGLRAAVFDFADEAAGRSPTDIKSETISSTPTATIEQRQAPAERKWYATIFERIGGRSALDATKKGECSFGRAS